MIIIPADRHTIEDRVTRGPVAGGDGARPCVMLQAEEDPIMPQRSPFDGKGLHDRACERAPGGTSELRPDTTDGAVALSKSP